MTPYLDELRSALVSRVLFVWPEVKANGIYRSRELARIDWTQKSASDLPLCVLDFDPVPATEWGLTPRADTVTVSIYRVVGDSESSATLLEKLEQLRLALWPDDGSNPLAYGQVLEYPAVSDSMDLPVNRYFLMTAKPCYAGAVVARVLMGETP
jgi:hypothetical protein